MASTTTANHAAANTERELRTAADATGTTYGTTNVSRNREAAEARLDLFMVTDILYRRAQGRIEAILEFVREIPPARFEIELGPPRVLSLPTRRFSIKRQSTRHARQINIFLITRLHPNETPGVSLQPRRQYTTLSRAIPESSSSTPRRLGSLELARC